MEGYPSPYPYATIDQALVEAQTALQPPEALVFSEGHQVEHAAVAAVENLPTTRQPRTWYIRTGSIAWVFVHKTNLYALCQGIATGAGVHKANLYSVFNVLEDAASVLKTNLYGVHHGIASGAAISKANVYGVMGGIASGSGAHKVNLYVVIDTIEDSSS